MSIEVRVQNPDDQVTVVRPTPQHDRLRVVKDKSQAIHEFLLEFLPEKDISLGQWTGRRYLPVTKSVTALVAEFFEIDLDELENEKRRMLQDIRVDNARRDVERELPTTGRKS